MPSHIQRAACQHLRRSGFSKTASARLASLISKWVSCSGPKWTAQRLKALQTFYHERLTKPFSQCTLPEGWAVKVNRRGMRTFKDGTLARLFGGEHNLALPDYEYQRFLINMLCKCGTLIFADRNNKVVLKATLESVTLPFHGDSDHLHQQEVIRFTDEIIACLSGLDLHRSNSSTYEVTGVLAPDNERNWDRAELSAAQERAFAPRIFSKSLVSQTPSRTRSWTHVPNKDGTISSTTLPHSDVKCMSPVLLLCHKDTPLADPLVSCDRASLMQLYQQWIGDPYGRAILFNQHLGRFSSKIACQDLTVGKLSPLTKDAFAKIRFIAMPCMDLQVQLEPLKLVLNNIVSRFKASGVHDQDRARLDVASWLKDKSTVYAFDFSSFTDRFPYRLQRDLLIEMRRRGLGVTSLDIKMMDFAVKGEWAVPAISPDYRVRFTVGQPMGLNPSFALATLSHLMVAQASYYRACESHNYQLLQLPPKKRREPMMDPRKWQDNVRIVGDDIVIKGDKFASEYSNLMTALGVPINHSKSMVSEYVSNFCGRIITPEGIDRSLRAKGLSNESPSLVRSQLDAYLEKAHRQFKKVIRKMGYFPVNPFPYGLGHEPYGIEPYSKWIRRCDQNYRAVTLVNKEIFDLVGPGVSESQIREASNRRRALVRYWANIGFIGKSSDLSNPSVTDQEMQQYFGLSKELNRTLGADGILFMPNNGPSFSESYIREKFSGSPSSEFVKLVDTAARLFKSNPSDPIVQLVLANRELYPDYQQFVNNYGYIRDRMPNDIVEPVPNRETERYPEDTIKAVKAWCQQNLCRFATTSCQFEQIPQTERIKVFKYHFTSYISEISNGNKDNSKWLRDAGRPEKLFLDIFKGKSGEQIYSEYQSWQVQQKQRTKAKSQVHRRKDENISRELQVGRQR